MPAPTTQTSALVFLSNVDDRMIEAVATQTEGVLRRLDSRFRAVLFLEGRLEVFFVMLANRESAPIRGQFRKCRGGYLFKITSTLAVASLSRLRKNDGTT